MTVLARCSQLVMKQSLAARPPRPCDLLAQREHTHHSSSISSRSRSSPHLCMEASETRPSSHISFAPTVTLTPPLKSQPSKGAALISGESVKRRLSRSNSYRTLVVESSSDAHVVLEEFANIPKPEWSQWRAFVYGAAIDWAILFQADRWLAPPFLDEFTRCLISCGGAEQMRFLLALSLIHI